MIIFMTMIYLPKFLLPMYYVNNMLSIYPPITSPQADHIRNLRASSSIEFVPFEYFVVLYLQENVTMDMYGYW